MISSPASKTAVQCRATPLSEPWAMAGFNVFAADSDEEGHRLRTSARQWTLALRRGKPRRLPPPDDGFEARLGRHERAMLDEQGACSAGSAPISANLFFVSHCVLYCLNMRRGGGWQDWTRTGKC